MAKMSRMKKYYIAGGTLLFVSLFFRLIMLPPITKMMTKKDTELRPGKFMRGIWNAYPFIFDFRVYIFNVTNAEEVAKGEKPILQEVGPYAYDMWQEKGNLMDYEEDDSVSYNDKATFYFNPTKSNGLTGEEEVVVPNYFILGLVNTLRIERPSAVPVIGKAVDSIFGKPSSIFMKAKVKDVLFDGYLINCTAKDFAGSAICSDIRVRYEVLNMKKIDEDIYLMSLFGTSNGTLSKNVVRNLRGSKKLMRLGEVIMFNGNTNLSTWNDGYCDGFHAASQGTIFHPFFKKTDDLSILVEGLCRVYHFTYLEDAKYSGMKTYRFTTSLGTDAEGDPKDKCYCTDPEKCYKKGIFDLFKCSHVPILISNPHFYLGDSSYVTAVEGLKPEKEKHFIHLDLQPLSGVPLHAHTRAQLNMELPKVEKFKLMKTMPGVILPLVWFEIELNLPDFLVKPIKQGKMMLTMGKSSFFLMLFGSFGMLGYAGILHYKLSRQKKGMDIKKTVQTAVQNNNLVNSVEDKSLPLNVSKLKSAQVPPNVE